LRNELPVRVGGDRHGRGGSHGEDSALGNLLGARGGRAQRRRLGPGKDCNVGQPHGQQWRLVLGKMERDGTCLWRGWTQPARGRRRGRRRARPRAFRSTLDAGQPGIPGAFMLRARGRRPLRDMAACLPANRRKRGRRSIARPFQGPTSKYIRIPRGSCATAAEQAATSHPNPSSGFHPLTISSKWRSSKISILHPFFFF
jgi:hypothetical protein